MIAQIQKIKLTTFLFSMISVFYKFGNYYSIAISKINNEVTNIGNNKKLFIDFEVVKKNRL